MKFKKVGLIIGIFLGSLILFVFFLLYNFPYNAVVRDMTRVVKRSYDADLAITEVKYIFPFTWHVYGLLFQIPKDTISVRCPEISISIKGLLFSKTQSLKLMGETIEFRNGASVSAQVERSTIVATGHLLRFGLKKPSKSLDSVSLNFDRTNIGEIRYYGFTIKPFIVDNIRVSTRKMGKIWNMQNGRVESTLFRATISGKFSPNTLDFVMVISPSKTLENDYPNIKSMLSTMMKDSSITLKLSGNPANPRVAIIQE